MTCINSLLYYSFTPCNCNHQKLIESCLTLLKTLNAALEGYKWLGLLLHPTQLSVSPSTVLVVLGIELDSVMQLACLLTEKFSSLQYLIISSWLPLKWRKQIRASITYWTLHHSAKMVWPGRTFLHCMIDLLICFCKGDHTIPHNRDFTWTFSNNTSFCLIGTE